MQYPWYFKNSNILKEFLCYYVLNICLSWPPGGGCGGVCDWLGIYLPRKNQETNWDFSEAAVLCTALYSRSALGKFEE